jgi:hypothetical protein
MMRCRGVLGFRNKDAQFAKQGNAIAKMGLCKDCTIFFTFANDFLLSVIQCRLTATN